MWRSRLDERRPAAWLAGLALMAAACAGPADGGVGVRSIATDLAFGPPPDTEPAAPAGIIPGADRGPLVIEGPAAQQPGVPIPTPPPPPACPFAPLTAAAEEAAPVDVRGRPEEGTYRWVLDGYHETAEFGRVPLGGLVARSIHDVEDMPDGFSFTTQERELQVGATAVVRTTYRVVEGSDLMDDGLYLTRIVRTGPDGQEREFNPSPVVMMFPLPAQIGEEPLGAAGIFLEQEQMRTVGIDPTTFEALHHRGTVIGKKQIDACGELLDGYLVEATQEFVSATGVSFQRRYSYSVATHMGGMIVFEEVAVPCGNFDEDAEECIPEPDFFYRVHLGQLEPDDPGGEG